MRFRSAAVFSLAASAAICSGQQSGPAAPQKPRVLLVGDAETEITKQLSGVGANAGGVVVGVGQTNQTVHEHSEVWETARRFLQDCPAVTVTTDPSAPSDFTVRLDYQKLPMNPFGITALYQLVVLTPQQNPIYIHKKDYLRRQIKPACKAILENWKTAGHPS